MSRTQKEIFDEMMADKSVDSNLDSLLPNPDNWNSLFTIANFRLIANTVIKRLSTSLVAIWRLMMYSVSWAIKVHEDLFDIHTAEIEARAKEIIPGTLRWYTTKAKEFQNGYALEWDGEKYVYLDTTSAAAIASMIVIQSAAVDANGEVIIKVAKDNGTGGLTYLSVSENASFSSYIDEIKFAGTLTRIISDPADLLQLEYTIQYDATLLDSTGTLIADGSTKPVEDAITDYISNIDFNNVFRVSDLTDAIQAATGVINAVADTVKAKYGSIAYIDILADPTETYLSNAGYLDIDPVYPLSSQITYIPV